MCQCSSTRHQTISRAWHRTISIRCIEDANSVRPGTSCVSCEKSREFVFVSARLARLIGADGRASKWATDRSGAHNKWCLCPTNGPRQNVEQQCRAHIDMSDLWCRAAPSRFLEKAAHRSARDVQLGPDRVRLLYLIRAQKSRANSRCVCKKHLTRSRSRLSIDVRRCAQMRLQSTTMALAWRRHAEARNNRTSCRSRSTRRLRRSKSTMVYVEDDITTIVRARSFRSRFVRRTRARRIE